MAAGRVAMSFAGLSFLFAALCRLAGAVTPAEKAALLDGSALIQAAMGKRADLAELPTGPPPPAALELDQPEALRKLSQKEIADAMSHMREMADELDPSDVIWTPKQHKDRRDMKDWGYAEWVARRYCIAHWGAGQSYEHIRDTYIAAFLADEGRTHEEALAFAKRHVKHMEIWPFKALRAKVNNSWSQTYKWTGSHHGCVPEYYYQGDFYPPDTKISATERNWVALNGNAGPVSDAPSRAIGTFFNKVMGAKHTSALVVLHRGYLVEGYCERECGVNRHTRLPLYSVGKSAQGLLVRKRAGEGKLDLHGYAHMSSLKANRSKWHTTNKYLLNMVAGSPPRETRVRGVIGIVEDLAEFAAATSERKWDVKPKTWYYSTGYSFVVGHELRYSFHDDDRAYVQYPWTGLFDAIGAESFLCERDWKRTIAFGSSCWATSRDMAKLGLVLLSNGKGPTGEQVVPKEAIDEIMAPGGGWGWNGFYVDGWYRMDKLCWWHDHGPVVLAQGVGGQVIIVAPKYDLVVARNAWTGNGDATIILDTEHWCQGALIDMLSHLKVYG